MDISFFMLFVFDDFFLYSYFFFPSPRPLSNDATLIHIVCILFIILVGLTIVLLDIVVNTLIPHDYLLIFRQIRHCPPRIAPLFLVSIGIPSIDQWMERRS
ncbi:hypothetical protein BC941DRAFT_443474 [Chlamydoabsidia padenii]|nr:hypothetical protein BC941DRAFT_443474 [Chlamydoabsidia padenii]